MASILFSRLCDACAEVGVVGRDVLRSFKELFDPTEFERLSEDTGFASATQALQALKITLSFPRTEISLQQEVWYDFSQRSHFIGLDVPVKVLSHAPHLVSISAVMIYTDFSSAKKQKN